MYNINFLTFKTTFAHVSKRKTDGKMGQPAQRDWQNGTENMNLQFLKQFPPEFGHNNAECYDKHIL